MTNIRVNTIEIAGMASALKALRLPFGKEPRSEVFADYEREGDKLLTASSCEINPKDLDLMNRLVKAGDCEAKVLRGIVVYTEITAPIYWWREAETYRHGHERLCSESTMHIDCKGMSGEELQVAKANILMGHPCTCIDSWSYQCLRNIYKWRKSHRLPEWLQFCAWIEQLPFAEQLITAGL